MKTKPNESIRELRKIIGQTQAEFAAMIGASKDTVVSWELGRNKLSATFARRIAFTTGAKADELLRGQRRLTTYIPFQGHPPLTAETFANHRGSYWGRSDEAAARQHHRHCADALGLIFAAAAKPAGGQAPCRLPAVLDSFCQWCEQTRADFHLETEIDELLAQRKEKFAINRSYRQWRQIQKELPDTCRIMGFKDDPQKSDGEPLRLEIDTCPVWKPGLPMRAPQPDSPPPVVPK